ncbi:oxygen-independent coproporphyrinogen III oxidase [Atopomonas hussainii]|uniref:oxygen-independent coproporphyrinogen III oxidase n=1 Tax=Atopomonas hussainii TaxID=1429083 RepID=UPI0008FFFD14|nr:oxygen-independent coproporphyrinogen III oxidase [Atopomonas hussainii]
MNTNPLWNTELIRRYDVAGPRYTSYPTAVQFHDGVTAFDLYQALRESKQALRPLSLYVHVPFCANICYYCACNKVITKDRGRSQPYLERLEREAGMLAKHLDSRQVVEQLHFGGGTPTFLSHSELTQLMQHLRHYFNLRSDDSGDYSIEIDPREADWTTMGVLRDLGFNRVSLGVQDINPEVQRAVNRLQSLEETRAVMDAARTLAYRSINVDLIYGLPKQTEDSFRDTVKAIIDMQPNRLSVFNYAHLPERFKPQRRINAADLPTPGEKLAMLHSTIELLSEAGYQYIGMDHFALPDDELAMAQENGTLHRNFQGYTTHGHCDLVSLGVSAISQIGDLYCQNSADLNDYQQHLDNGQPAIVRGLKMNDDDHLRRWVIQQLACHFKLDFAAFQQRFNVAFHDYFAAEMPALLQQAQDQLISLDSHGIAVSPAGRLLVRSVCMVFDRYLPQVNTQRFSRVI